MIEMIISSEKHEVGSIAEIVIGESSKYIRRASYYIRAEAGSAEGGEHIYEAVKIKEIAPIRK